jgi:hypothetical protein
VSTLLSRVTTRTHNLVDHDEHTHLCVLGALCIPVYYDSPSLIQTLIGSVHVVCTQIVWIGRFGIEEKDITACEGSHLIKVVQDRLPKAIDCGIEDVVQVYIDDCTSLKVVSTDLELHVRYESTKAIGVSLRILVLILCTNTPSPDTQTFVTSVFVGIRCEVGIAFGSDDMTA